MLTRLPICFSMCPRGQKNFTDFMNRFGRITPKPFPSKSKSETAVKLADKAAALALTPMWYSYEYGMAHIGVSSWLDPFQVLANS